MNTAETIYELVKTLPEDKANVVLAFAEFICQRPQPTASSEQPSFSDFFGILKDSPTFSGDPVAIQNSMRGDHHTSVSQADNIRAHLLENYGEFPDSADLIREDRAR